MRAKTVPRLPPTHPSLPQSTLPQWRESLHHQRHHLAKNVDLRNATSAALLAKALKQASFAKLDPENKLKTAPQATRAVVMEYVSTCVAVPISAFKITCSCPDVVDKRGYIPRSRTCVPVQGEIIVMIWEYTLIHVKHLSSVMVNWSQTCAQALFN